MLDSFTATCAMRSAIWNDRAGDDDLAGYGPALDRCHLYAGPLDGFGAELYGSLRSSASACTRGGLWLRRLSRTTKQLHGTNCGDSGRPQASTSADHQADGQNNQTTNHGVYSLCTRRSRCRAVLREIAIAKLGLPKSRQ